MHLYEHEAKKLLSAYGIKIPRFLSLVNIADVLPEEIEFPTVAKVQLLQGKRGLRGGVRIANSRGELESIFQNFREKKFDEENVEYILLEELVEDNGKDLYLAVKYDQEYNGPLLFFGEHGGMNVEDLGKELDVMPLDLGEASKVNLNNRELENILSKILNCFFSEDLRFIEINPLRVLDNGEYWALDAKIILDERANSRHPERSFKNRTNVMGRRYTERELAVIEINKNTEYKGTPCKYVELDGNVALLLSGGGASLLVFDQLIENGIKPGNYSEYSGNPKREKVEELTRVILSKPYQVGLLIAGAVANFTMIDETMAGIANVLRDLKPSYPIVIRRDGPNAQVGKQIMMELKSGHGLDITWFGGGTSLYDATQFFIQRIKA